MNYQILQLICFSVIYADDTSMFASGKDTNSMVSNLNNTLPTVYDW